LFADGNAVEALAEGQQGIVILNRTPFYAESGGQVGDQGVLETANALFDVQDTQKQNDVYTHIGVVKKGTLNSGDNVKARINHSERREIAYNHSATHLLHAALRQVLGDHVTQKGSLVEADRLRFDFSHFEPISPEQLKDIEDLVNEKIRANYAVETRMMKQDEAMAAGAMALFGEKYGDIVRVLSMGEFSVELCGGTHVNRTGDIGMFKIISESGVAAGVRRIEAVSGPGALRWVRNNESRLQKLAKLVKGSPDNLDDKVRQVLEKNRQLEKDVEQLKAKLASSQGSDLVSQAKEIDGVKVLAARLDGADPKSLRDTMDQLKNKLGSAAVVLAAVNGEKINLVAGVTSDQTSRLKAGNLVNAVAQQVGGKGGGRPDMAMAGGNNPAALDAALSSVPDWVRDQLAS
jgi:alanyl-tRNA synthetase